MTMIIPIITALVATVGLALILLDRFKVPSYAVSKATHNLGKRQNKKINPLEIWLKEIANWLSGKLRLNEYKRMQLDADLKTADMDMTPEMCVADNIIKSLFIGVFAIPVFKSIKNEIISEAMRIHSENGGSFSISHLKQEKGEAKSSGKGGSGGQCYTHSGKQYYSQSQKTSSAVAVTSLLRSLANIFRDKIDDDNSGKTFIDKRQRRDIEDKKNAEMHMV